MMRVTRNLKTRVLAAAAAAVLTSGACISKQETPPLTGPSGLGTSIVVEVSPDVLSQDGRSQSLVTITARGPNGNLLGNLTVRAEIQVNGVTADFGSLSARTLVTDGNGRATLVYTAPPAPSGVSAETTVAIAVTPLGTDSANATSRQASIRLVPPGTIPLPSGLVPAFVFQPLAPADHQDVLFDATSSKAPANNPIQLFRWDFGDGTTGTGPTVHHSFNLPGSFIVTLTISDAQGQSAGTSQTVSVAGGAQPTAAFTSSPTAPRIGQDVVFDASLSRPASGRRIVSYDWNFGDGDTKHVTTSSTSHDFGFAGTFNVSLTVTDDAGRVAVATSTVTVGTDNPIADFTFSPASPTAGAAVSFNGNGSSAVAPRTISSFAWDFGDGSSSSSATPSHPFAAAGDFNVTLTVTDSAGKIGRVTKTVTVK